MEKESSKHSRTRSRSPPNISKSKLKDKEKPKDSGNSTSGPFSAVNATNAGPSERYGHSAVFEETGGGLMIIFGGCDNKGAFCDDLWTYNVENNSWTKHQKREGGPTGRHFHSAVVHRQTMYVFGGSSNAYYNDLYSFDLDTQHWTHIVTSDSLPPSPRYGHSAVLVGSNMYIYGGFDKDGFACNEIYEFSIETNKWRVMKVDTSTSGIASGKDAYYHTAVSCHGSMYVLGGYKHSSADLMEFRFSTRTWSVVKTTGSAPSPRWGHRSIVYQGKMYVFGGRDQVRNFADVYELDFDTFHWTKSAEGGIAARFFCSAVAAEDRMLVFGGRNIYNFSFNDLYAYDFATERRRRPDTYVDDFHRLVNERELSDVSFHFPDEDNQIIFAHKTILSARCPPFSAMFRVGMKEALAGKIVIRNLKHVVFLSLIEYLYTGQLFSSAEHLPELLTAADMYSLDHLKALVERRLVKYADSHNALFLFSIGDQYKAYELKHHCLAMVLKCWNAELRSSEQFRSLSDELRNEILSSLNTASNSSSSTTTTTSSNNNQTNQQTTNSNQNVTATIASSASSGNNATSASSAGTTNSNANNSIPTFSSSPASFQQQGSLEKIVPSTIPPASSSSANVVVVLQPTGVSTPATTTNVSNTNTNATAATSSSSSYHNSSSSPTSSVTNVNK